MAGNDLAAKVSAMRQHLRDTAPDETSARVGEQHLLNLLDAFGAPDDAGGESIGERGEAADMALDRIFRRHPAPRVANSVR
jgi:hypothetical protein